MAFLEANNIQKSFGRIVALRGVDLEVRKGEIHALLGENGAGKTTLMNILYGLLSPDSGSLQLGQKPYRPRSPQDAMGSGVGMVHQHFMLVPTLTVLQNVLLGDSPFSAYRKEVMRDRLRNRMEQLSFDLPIESRVEELSVGVRQRVEIFKALWKGAQLLILDEPTAVLAPQEIEDLFGLLKDLKSEGHSILFISHKLDEIQELCDRVTLLRKGETVGTYQVSEVDRQEMTQLLLGRALSPLTKRQRTQNPTNPFHVRPNPSPHGRLKEGWICDLYPGQITAIAGIEGNGQRELAEAIVGVSSTDSVSIEMEGHSLPSGSPDRISSGVGLISEDRQRTGLVMDFTVEENLALKDIARVPWSKGGWLQKDKIRRTANQLIEQYRVDPPDASRLVSDLSGGNQQKVVVAREISRNHRLLVAFNPTRGLDVGACENVYDALIADAESGAAILLISTELEEVQQLADRVYVLFNGQLTKISEDNWSADRLGLAMMGADTGESC